MKKNKPLFIIASIIISICVVCGVAVLAISLTTPPLTTNPQPPTANSQPPIENTEAPQDPTIQLATQYAQEYDGSYDAYYQIFTSTDCAFLQEQFDIAYETNENAEAGTIHHKRSLGFMLASDERMQEIGCY